MKNMSPFARLKLFYADTRGSVTVEFVMVMPALFWAFMAIYVYFDGYRQSALNLKAAYTISDLVSRETDVITPGYIDSMHSLLKVLIRSDSNVKMRITVIRWDQDDDRYYVKWSTNRGYIQDLSNANISTLRTKLPVMPHNEQVILVETVSVFEPPFKVGMDNQSLDNFVFTRPRFTNQAAPYLPS
jgi:Flp pilus assembly protein TadG